jgi:hypothetical protein
MKSIAAPLNQWTWMKRFYHSKVKSFSGNVPPPKTKIYKICDTSSHDMNMYLRKGRKRKEEDNCYASYSSSADGHKFYMDNVFLIQQTV